MQQKRPIPSRQANTSDTRIPASSAAINGRENRCDAAMSATASPPLNSEQAHTAEHYTPPPIRMPVGYVVQSSHAGKGLGSGEKQALAGGVFVMFSLAAALAIGWWVTPATPTLPSTTETQARATRPAPIPPVRNEEPQEFNERVATGEILMHIDRDAVEEVSVLPLPAPTASTTRKGGGEALVSTRETPPASATTDQEKADTPPKAELQRLKAQAYSETRKDRLGVSPPANERSGTSTNKQPSPSRERNTPPARIDLSDAVAECSNEAGIISRERCKWRLCNGRWGKYGCPSYDNGPQANRQAGTLDGYQQATPNKKARQVSLSRFTFFG